MGGIQRQLLEVCNELIARNSKCTVAGFRSQNDEMSEMYSRAGVRVVFLGKRRPIDIPFLFNLYKLIRKENFDLIHCMTAHASFWTAIVLPLFKRPCFVGSLLNTYQLDKLINRLCESLIAAPRLDAVFINSETVATYYKSKIFNAPTIWCVHNGVHICSPNNRKDIRKELGISHDEFSVVCVGRLAPVKRHKDAIEAIGNLIRQRKQLRLFLIGDGTLREELEALVKNLQLEKYVTFLGNRTDVERILPSFDLFLLPSESESFPNALLEAMASGLPCIATRVGGVPEALEHGKTGLLIDPSSPDQLTAAISSLLDSQKLRSELGRAARLGVERRFSMNRMIDKMISHYEGFLKAQRYDLAYVLSIFPEISETFILREIVEMRKRGLSCCVVSLKSSTDKTMHKDASEMINDVFYLPWFGKKEIKANLGYIFKQPKRYIKTFIEFIFAHRKYPGELVKAFAVWWKTVAFASLLKEHGVRHIHANWATIPTACAIAISRLMGCPFSFTGHAFDIYAKPTDLKNKIQQACFVTTCTRRNLDYLRSLTDEISGKKIFLVRHFLSLKKETSPSSPSLPPVVLAVGSLLKYKGHDYLLRAVSILFKKGYHFQLHIIGGGPEETSLKNLSKELKIADKIVFLGSQPVERVFEEMRKATLFAIASIQGQVVEDNLPNVLIEASLLKVPCVASDLGSIREFIIPGETGLLVEPGNIGQLAESIESLLNDQPFGKRLAAKAQKRADDMFSIGKNAPILEELFQKSLDMSR